MVRVGVVSDAEGEGEGEGEGGGRGRNGCGGGKGGGEDEVYSYALSCHMSSGSLAEGAARSDTPPASGPCAAAANLAHSARSL